MGTVDPLQRGREAYGRMAWRDACELLSEADRRESLEGGDLARLARAAYLTGRYEASDGAWARAHRAYLDAGDAPSAARCAFWLGLLLVMRGEHARGGGWIARARRLVEDAPFDCVESGYLRLPAALGALEGGDGAAAHEIFVELTGIAERFADPDLKALGRLGQGQALVGQGRVVEGMALLDEAMLAVTTGEVSAVAAGIVYCAVVLACRDAFDVRRVQEWTAELGRWCAAQQDLQPYQGQCLVHRSEIMQLRGEWADAMDEVRRACEHLAERGGPVVGMAEYQRAELHRLRGEYAAAEVSYRQASGSGHPVQPGMALLRLAQGRVDGAVAAIALTAAEAQEPVERSKILAAYVEIKLAAGEIEDARAAQRELGVIAERFDSPYLRALVGQAAGAVLLAEGDAEGACARLRRAQRAWHELGAPYEAARARLLIARGCASLGDRDTVEMELDAARRVFERLGAAPALERVRELSGRAAAPAVGGLTPGRSRSCAWWRPARRTGRSPTPS
ncbi:hypothetical protein GCM10029992_47280 [Glycomyces albus]